MQCFEVSNIIKKMSRLSSTYLMLSIFCLAVVVNHQVLSTSYIAPKSCSSSPSPSSDSYKYCGRISITEFETNFIYSQTLTFPKDFISSERNDCLSLAPSNFTLKDNYSNLPPMIGNPFFMIENYFNTTWCTCRWKNSTSIISTRKELCAINQESKIFYIISDSYNLDKTERSLLVDKTVSENYFVNTSMTTPNAYDDTVFIVKGPNFVLTNWKNGIIGTVSNQHPKLLVDSSFHFQFSPIGSGDKNGPGILLKNLYSDNCLTSTIDPITSSIKLRMQTCSGVNTLKKAAQKGDDIANLYSKQKFFWTGRFLFSSKIANSNLGQLESIAVTSSLFGSPYLKSKGVQFLTLTSLNESSVEKYYSTACLFDQDSILQKQLSEPDVRFSSVLLWNNSSRVFWKSGMLISFIIIILNLF